MRLLPVMYDEDGTAVKILKEGRRSWYGRVNFPSEMVSVGDSRVKEMVSNGHESNIKVVRGRTQPSFIAITRVMKVKARPVHDIRLQEIFSEFSAWIAVKCLAV